MHFLAFYLERSFHGVYGTHSTLDDDVHRARIRDEQQRPRNRYCASEGVFLHPSTCKSYCLQLPRVENSITDSLFHLQVNPNKLSQLFDFEPQRV